MTHRPTTLPTNLLTNQTLNEIVRYQTENSYTPSPCTQVLLDAMAELDTGLPDMALYRSVEGRNNTGAMTPYLEARSAACVPESLLHRWIVLDVVNTGTAIQNQDMGLQDTLRASRNWAHSPTAQNIAEVVYSFRGTPEPLPDSGSSMTPTHHRYTFRQYLVALIAKHNPEFYGHSLTATNGVELSRSMTCAQSSWWIEHTMAEYETLRAAGQNPLRISDAELNRTYNRIVLYCHLERWLPEPV